MKELTAQQKQAIDEMVERRMHNTGETEATAKVHILNFLIERLNG